jgi:MFS family permease
VLARYRPVLAMPGSSRLFATGVVARLPQGMVSLSCLLLVRAATHSYALAGLAVGGEALAAAAAGPTQGRLVDRFGRGRVLGPWALAQATLLVALVVAAHAGAPGLALVSIACGIGAAQPALAPAVRALLRTLFDEPGVRESAYALESVIQELIWISGPLLVALVVSVSSPSGALLVCAAIGLLGTALFVASPAGRQHRPPRRGAQPAILRKLPELRRLLVPIALMGVAIGATEVGLPSLALHAGSRASTGLLLATWSAGSMIGGLLYGAREWGVALAERYRRLLAGAVVGAAPLVFAHSIAAGLVGSLLTGLSIAPVFSCQYALVGRVAQAGAETEAFTWASSALVAGIAGGSALGGALIGGLGVSAPFLVSCGALAIAAATSVRARQIASVAAG